MSNLILTCLECHRNIHRDEGAAERMGHIVGEWSDGEMTPLLVRGEFWAYLDPDEGYRYVKAEEARAVVDLVAEAHKILRNLFARAA